MLNLVLMSILLGIGDFYLVEMVRRLPGIEKKVLQGVRPWSCDLCMSFWTSLFSSAWLGMSYKLTPHFFWWERFAIHVGTAGVTLAFLSWYASLDPPSGPDIPLH